MLSFSEDLDGLRLRFVQTPNPKRTVLTTTGRASVSQGTGTASNWKLSHPRPAGSVMLYIRIDETLLEAFTAISDQTHHEKAISKAQSRDHNVGTNQEHFHQ